MKIRHLILLGIVLGLLFAPVDTTNVLSGFVHHVASLFQSFNLH